MPSTYFLRTLKGELPDKAAMTSRKRASENALAPDRTTIDMFRFAMTPKEDNDTSVRTTARRQTGYDVLGCKLMPITAYMMRAFRETNDKRKIC